MYDGIIMSFMEPTSLEVFLTIISARTFARPFYKRSIKSLELKGNEKVLDYGSGSGAAAKLIAKSLHKKGGRLMCVDISKTWMKIIIKRMKNFSNIEFKLGDITNLDIKNSFFDVILIHFTLHDIEEGFRSEKLKILVRKLKNNGRLITIEPTKESHGMPIQEIHDLMDSAGLKEIDCKTSKPFLIGPVYKGVFTKSS